MNWNGRFRKHKRIVNQKAVQTATAVMMTFRDTETGPSLTTTQNQWKNQRWGNRRLVMEKLRFNWDMPDRHVQLLNFQLEVTDILETKVYEINDDERIPVIKNWLGSEGLLIMKAFMQEEMEKYNTIKGLFLVLSNRFQPCDNHIILALQYQKLHKKQWICSGMDGHIANKCSWLWVQGPWQMSNRAVNRQAKWWWHDWWDIKRSHNLENIEEAMSAYMLGWTHRVEGQRTQRSMLNDIKEAKAFAMQQNSQTEVCRAHVVKMQVLWHRVPCPGVPCIWKEVWRVWEGSADHFGTTNKLVAQDSKWGAPGGWDKPVSARRPRLKLWHGKGKIYKSWQH